ncbi:transglutaminase domain-containing protein [Anaeromyxobacter oryzae]|uniref:Transglutaminase-like domain-containing protein n=1 Tax=Anaeromyxobacter oryzae TaxID=2918170 RepID=A0ABN6MRU8_9BACT|nr:transglutaminase domain-containing protein [Anaeromyxobacter oryzae]BDG03713.1 hypothetical protein AMOR_27090 [Anaeromyxobacter oryzae]
MTAVLAAALLAALPAGSARYRVEIGGVHVGVAELEVRCEGARCRARFASRLAHGEAAGGRIAARTTHVEVDGAGRVAGPVAVEVDGAPVPARVVPGAVPAALAEVVLLDRLRAGGDPCAEVFDEESGAAAPACARRDGEVAVVEVLGVVERIVPGADGWPAEIAIPAQRARYVRDEHAALPASPLRLEVRVPGPADPRLARRFCGLEVDPPAPRAPAAAPEPRAPGASCREQAAAWVALARARGLDARVAVGVAHDGAGFVWHAWAEVRDGAAWIAVDPAFREAPARAPRFTVARYRPDDAAARDAAGRRILACWGAARVE